MIFTILDLAKAQTEHSEWYAWLPPTTVSTIISSIISAILAAVLSNHYANQRHKQDMLDKLDSKSGWRKELFELSFKSEYTVDDAFKFLSFIRFKTHSNPESTFEYATNLMHKVCDEIVETDKNMKTKELDNSNYYIHKYKDNINIHIKNENKLKKVNIEYSIIDSFTKYLLTHQWEYLQLSSKEQSKIKKQSKNEKFNKKESELFIFIYEKVQCSQYANIIPKNVTCHYKKKIRHKKDNTN